MEGPRWNYPLPDTDEGNEQVTQPHEEEIILEHKDNDSPDYETRNIT